jgi:hypothetical protein
MDRFEQLKVVYEAARREYEEAFFAGDAVRMVVAWDGEQRALAAMLAAQQQNEDVTEPDPAWVGSARRMRSSHWSLGYMTTETGSMTGGG